MESYLYAAVEVWIRQYYLGRLLERRVRSKQISSLLILAVSLLLFTGKNQSGIGTIFDARVDISVILEIAVNIGSTALIAACFYRAALWRKLFAVLTLNAVELVCGVINHVVYSSSVMQKLQELLWWKIAAAGKIYHMAVILLSELFQALTLVLIFFLLRRIAQNFREKESVINRKELLFLIMPSLTALLTTAFWYIEQIQGNREDSAASVRLSGNSPVLFVLLIIMMCFLLAAIVHGVQLYQDVLRLGREKNSRIVLEQQIGSLQEHIRETERMWEGIRSLRHDMRNTLAVAERLPGGELQDYLAELNRTMKKMESRFQTGSVVADILLEMKCHEALRSMPDLKVDTDNLFFPDGLLIQSYDIGVILGNALDNALEACRKLRKEEPEEEIFVRVYSVLRGRTFLMGMENSFDGRILCREGEEFPVTDKADRELHGIGLANIRRACEKYHGDVAWEARGKVFLLTVIFRNEESAR